MNEVKSLKPGDLQQLLETTTLSEAQILRLHKRFVKLDVDCRGSISKDKFAAIPSLSSKPLLERVLSVVDTTGNNEIDFVEFAKAFSVFSPDTDRREKMRFTYKMYDIDRDGKISNKDLYQTLKIMVGTNLTDIQLQQIVDKTFIEVDLNRDGYITFDEFEKLTLAGDIVDKLTVQL